MCKLTGKSAHFLTYIKLFPFLLVIVRNIKYVSYKKLIKIFGLTLTSRKFCLVLFLLAALNNFVYFHSIGFHYRDSLASVRTFTTPLSAEKDNAWLTRVFAATYKN